MSLDDFTPFAEIHASLPRHRKTYALAHILSQKRTTICGMLMFLWLWALDDGTGFLPADSIALADIMMWDGDPNLLSKALVSTQWLDVINETTWRIHDWDNYTGLYQKKKLARQEQNRIAQQKHRLKQIGSGKSTVSMTSASRKADISTQPNLTEPNLTEHRTMVVSDNTVARICNEIESNLGMINPMTLDEIKLLANEVPADWFSLAIKEACDNNSRKWSYVRSILENWQAKGGIQLKQTKRESQTTDVDSHGKKRRYVN